MREKTVVALFDTFEDAQGAVQDLAGIGVPKDKISLLANNMEGRHPGLMTNPAFIKSDMEKESDATSGLGLGVEIGGAVGIILGLLVGLGTITIPGIGALVAAGAWATVAAGAGAGVVVGGAIGMLTDHGITKEDAHLYAEGLRRGGTLVAVHGLESDVERLSDLFRKRAAVDIEQRGAHWRAEGWVSFDHDAQPLTAAEIEAMRVRDAAAGDDAHHTPHHFFRPGEQNISGGISNTTTRYGTDEAGV